jgi:hypothetical protein
MRVEVRSQAEMEAAIQAGNTPICIEGRFVLSASMRAELWESSSAELWESSSAVLWESSSAVLWESSSAVLRGSSSAVLWESSSAVLRGSSSAVLRGSSSAELWESSSAVLRESSSAKAFGAAILRVFSCAAVIASAMVTVVIHGCKEKVTGGSQIKVQQPKTPREWCEFYGAEIVDGHAVLYKGVGDNWLSPKGGDYTPGTVPQCADWDGGKEECGGGFHFSPHPLMTLEFNSAATKFVACPVLLSEIAVHENAKYPNKVKASGCCAPTWEVDRKGKRVKATEQVAVEA